MVENRSTSWEFIIATGTDWITTEGTQLRPSRRIVGTTALCGLVLFLVSLAGWAPESSPGAGSATAEEIRRYAEDNAGLLRLNLMAALVDVSVFAFFVWGLAEIIRQARPASIVPGVVLLCGAAAAAADLLRAAAAGIFAFPHEMDGISDRAVVTLNNMGAASELFGAFTLATVCTVLVTSFSWVALRDRLMARWVCVAGFALTLVAAIQIAQAGLQFPLADGTFLIIIFGWALWPLAVGGALGVRWMRTRETP